MANYAALKAAIQQVVKTNGNKEITGALLQQSLLAMVNSLGAYYQYVGIATPATNPGTPDQNVYYIASTPGSYPNFGSVVLDENEVAFLKYNGQWIKETGGFASADVVQGLINTVNAIVDEQNIDVTGTGTWQVGRILPGGFYPSYTGYKYMRFNARKDDVIHYSGYADTASIVFGRVDGSSVERIAAGNGSTRVYGDYTVLEDGEFAIGGYNNYTISASITRDGILNDIETRLGNVENNIAAYKINLLENVNWLTGRVISSTGSPNSTYTSYRYAIFDVRKNDIINYSGYADSATSVFGYAKPGIAVFTPVSVGAGASTKVSGTFVAPYDCRIVICGYNNLSSTLIKDVPAIGNRVQNLEDLEPTLAEIQNNLGDCTETNIEITLISGQYINNTGVVNTLAGSYMTAPVYLEKGMVVRLYGVFPSAVSAISKTDVNGSYYAPVVRGTSENNGGVIIEYRIPETGYYALSATYSLRAVSLSYTKALEAINELSNKIADIAFDGGNILATFDNIVCVGDSLTWSQVYFGSGVSDQRQARRTYPAVLGALCGCETQLLATPGDTAKHCWDTQKNNIVSKTNPLAIIYLGTNAGLTDTLATDVVGDNPDNWADNNTGCYCRFVQKFQSLGYKVLLLRVWATSADKETTNSAITHIGERFGCAVMDVPYTTEIQYHYYPDLSGSNGLHYNDLGYSWFASALIKESGKLSTNEMRLLIPN